jgi:hypothetical protein
MKRHYQQQNDEGSILSMGGHIKHCKAKRNVVTTAPTTTVCASYLDLQNKLFSILDLLNSVMIRG